MSWGLFSCTKSLKVLRAWPAICQVQQRRVFYGYFVGWKTSKLLKCFRRRTLATAGIGILRPVCAFQRVNKSLLGNRLFRQRTSIWLPSLVYAAAAGIFCRRHMFLSFLVPQKVRRLLCQTGTVRLLILPEFVDRRIERRFNSIRRAVGLCSNRLPESLGWIRRRCR